MPAAREIKRRIKSISNTKKITKAMELVSAAKMRKAVNRVLSSRHYASSSWQVLMDLASKHSTRREQEEIKALHPLLQERPEIFNAAVVVISSNRGLCGGFNNNLVEQGLRVWRHAKELGQKVSFITFGKKAREGLMRAGAPIAADFLKDDITTDILKTAPLVRLIIDDFLQYKYDKVELIYTDFISTLIQKVQVKKILPLDTKADELLGKIKGESAGTSDKAGKQERVAGGLEDWQEYIFEPGPDQILEELLPRLLEVQIYQAVLESEGSEHSARMLAMRNASEAAGDIIGDLTLTYNQARQANITREIAEISAGKIALE